MPLSNVKTPNGSAGGGETGRGPVVDTFFETAGLKAVVLVGFLFAVTVTSAVYGVRAVEGLYAGAALAAVLAVALVFERLLLRDRTDVVGFVVLAVVIGYTAVEYTGQRQNLWFPAAAAGLLAVTMAVEAYRWLDDPDVLEFFNEIDIVGLYGVILLIVYSLLLVGGQLDFIYSPYFPAVLFVFVATVLVSSVSYLTGGQEMPGRGELHERLISVVRGLDDIGYEDRQPLVDHVRAVANAINGVQVPTRVGDDEGSVPVVLPVDRPQEKVYPRLESTVEHLNHRRFTGYLVTEAGDVVLFKNGRPCKYYLREDDVFGSPDTVGDLPGIELGEAYAFHAPYSLVDSVEAVTPAETREGRQPLRETPVETVEEAASGSVAQADAGQAAAEALGMRGDTQAQAAKSQRSGEAPEAEAAVLEEQEEEPISDMVDEAFEKYERKTRGEDVEESEEGEATEPEPEEVEAEAAAESQETVDVETPLGQPETTPTEAGREAPSSEPAAGLGETAAEPTGEAAEPREPREADDHEPVAEGEDQGDEDDEGTTLDVGGEEINVQEMVDLADEVMDELEDL